MIYGLLTCFKKKLNGEIFQPELHILPHIQVRQFILLKRSVMSPNTHILLQNHKSKQRLLSSAEAQSQISV